MAVVLLDQQGVAQDFPDQSAANAALQAGTHSIPLVSPEGEPAAVPLAEHDKSIASGFTVPTPPQLQSLRDEAKYGTAGQTAIAGLEGAAETASLGTSGALEAEAGKALGIPSMSAEAQLKRKEQSPVVHGVGEAAGVIAPALLGDEAGALNVLGNVGHIGEALGVGAAKAALPTSKLAERIGGWAGRGAIEGGMLSGEHVLNESLLGDPDATAEHAAAEIGLSSIIGGVAGPVIGAGFEGAAGLGKKLLGGKGELLANLTRLKPNAPEINAAAERLGVEPLPGQVSASKTVQDLQSVIAKEPTIVGQKEQALVDQQFNAIRGATQEALGDSASMTKAEVGESLRTGLKTKLEEAYQPTQQAYEYLKGVMKEVPLDDGALIKATRAIRNIEGVRVSPSSPEYKLAENTAEEIRALSTVDELRQYVSSLGRQTAGNPALRYVAGAIRGVLNDLEQQTVERTFKEVVGGNAPASASIERLLQHGKFAIVSASRETRTPLQNAVATNALKADLEAAGAKFLPVKGQWGGQPESSFIIANPNDRKVAALANKYEQLAHIQGKAGQFSEVSHSSNYQPTPGGKGYEVGGHLANNYSEVDTREGPLRFRLNLAGAAPEAKNLANEEARRVADTYAKTRGIKLDHELPRVTADPERGAKIAEAYEAMQHDPNNPEVQKAYHALIRETGDQFATMLAKGLKVSKIEPGQPNPYKDSAAMLKDVRENNHLYYYPTESGFGTANAAGDHPLLQMTKFVNDQGEQMPANDVFRVVHDYFGHAKEGYTFGASGEENAWRQHMQTYSPEAQRALTSETRGQNSWVNYGPHGEANRANPANTVYAEQKAGLLPEWVSTLETKHAPAGATPSAQAYSTLREQIQSSKQAYKELIGQMGELGDVIGKRRVYGPTDFLNHLADIPAEKLADRLFQKNNSKFLSFLQEQFPEQAGTLARYQKSVIAEKAFKDGIVNPGLVKREVDRLEPEVQRFLFKKEDLAKLEDAKTLLDAMPKDVNPSGTAKTANWSDALNPFKHVPEALAGGLISGIPGAVAGAVAGTAGPEISSLLKRGVMRGLVSASGAEATRHAALSKVADLARRTADSISSAAKAALSKGAGERLTMSKTERDRVMTRVSELSEDPQKLLDRVSKVTDGMQDHAPGVSTALASTAGRASQFLQTVAPQPLQMSPFAKPVEPSEFQKAAFKRSAEAVFDPVGVLSRVSDGTIMTQDVAALQAVYPKLYSSMRDALTEALGNAVNKGTTVPYRARLGASVFLGQSIDRSMSQQSIAAVQLGFADQAMAKQPPDASGGAPKKSTKALAKVGEQSRTPEQAASERRLKS